MCAKAKGPDLRTKTNMPSELWQELGKMIKELSKKREELLRHHTDEEIEKIIDSYYYTDDEGQKAKIEEIAMLYHFPMALIITKNAYRYMKNKIYSKDLFNKLLFDIIVILRRYTPNTNNKFSTYLATSLRGEMMKFLDNTKVVKYNYYYIVKKFGRDFTKIIMESDLDVVLDGEGDIDEYTAEKMKSILEDYKVQNMEYGYSYYWLVIDFYEHFKAFITKRYNDVQREVILEYYVSHKTNREVSVANLADMYGLERQAVYRLLKEAISSFVEYCKDKRNYELNDLYNMLKEYWDEDSFDGV